MKRPYFLLMTAAIAVLITGIATFSACNKDNDKNDENKSSSSGACYQVTTKFNDGRTHTEYRWAESEAKLEESLQQQKDFLDRCSANPDWYANGGKIFYKRAKASDKDACYDENEHTL